MTILIIILFYIQYKKKMEHNNWKKAVVRQSFEFDYSFFDDIKVTLDLDRQRSKDVNNWKISARSPLKV